MAQEQPYKLAENIQLNGYLKYLHQHHFINDSTLLNNTIWHNRLNLKVYLPKNLSFAAGIRSRAIYGEEIRSNDILAKSLIRNSDAHPVEIDWYHKNGVILYTNIDRLWLDWSGDKTEIRVGKQRINWGIHTVWNPNDIFNTFNFVDFDYEERPGSDAIRVQRYIGDFNSLEFVWKDNAEGKNDYALKYQWNTHSYDIQVIAGSYREDKMIGLGWAGPIKNMGFKGEFSHYFPEKGNDQVSVFTTGIDYSFKNGYYINGSYLYQSNGSNDENPFALLSFVNGPTAKSLMPSKHSLFMQISKQYSPLFVADLALIHAINMNFWFVMPSVHYSLREDLDLSLVGQIYHSNLSENFIITDTNDVQVFLRLKYSF
jgi:hypothetical protein